MKILLAALFTLALLGCSGEKPMSGNEWADKTFGPEGARTLLRHPVSASQTLFERELKGAAMVLPRPFVIVSRGSDPSGRRGELGPEFHDLNAVLPPEMSPKSVAEVRAIVHLEGSSITKSTGDIQIRRRTVKTYKTEDFLCVAISVPQPDGSFKTVAVEAVDTTDPKELLEYLQSLPAARR